jgi:DNA-binding transcriptional LysR family regulator
LKVPSTQMVSFSLPLHHHLLATGRFVTMLPASMLRFGKHLPLKLLSVEMTEIPYPTGIVTLQNRTLSPMAQVFIDSARKIAAMMVKTR